MPGGLIKSDTSCSSQFGDAPGVSETGLALSFLLPPVGSLFPSRGCRTSGSCSHFSPRGSVRGTIPSGLGVGLWFTSSAPAPQLSCWQPVCDRVPRKPSQLYPAVLVAAIPSNLLGKHSWAQRVCQVPAACSAEQGCLTGCVHFERGGGGRDLLWAASQRGGPGDPFRPPERGRNYPDHGDGFCLSGWEEERGEGSRGLHRVRNRTTWKMYSSGLLYAVGRRNKRQTLSRFILLFDSWHHKIIYWWQT